MVADTAGIAHAGGGNDDLGGLVVVESPGLLGGLGEGEAREGEQVFAPLNDGDGVVVQVALQVTGVNLGSFGGQRGVHIDLKAGQRLDQTVPLDLPQVIQQLLGPPHSEGGDNDVAPLGEDLVNQGGQGPGVALRGLVVPVAVGGLHHHIVGGVHKGGVPDNGLGLVAQVAGKDDFSGHPVLGGPELQNGGAQQVARVVKADLYPLAQVKAPAVLHRLQHVDGLLGVHQGIQRFHRGQAGTLALLVVPLGVPLLDVGGVPQHHRHELRGETGGEDAAVKALLHQQGQPAGVVNVGMGDQNVVDVIGGKIQGVVVVLILALLQPTVNEDFLAVDLQAVTAACYRMGGAEKCQFHGAASLCRKWLSLLYTIPREKATGNC